MPRVKVDDVTIRVTAEELKNTIEGQLLVTLYNEKAYNDMGILLKDLKNKVNDNKTVLKLRKLERAGLVKSVQSLVGRNKYISLTDLGKRVAEAIIGKTPNTGDEAKNEG